MSTPRELPKDELVPTQRAPKPKLNPLLCRQCEALQFRRPDNPSYVPGFDEFTPLARDLSLGVELVRGVVRPCNALVPFGPVKAGGCMWLRGMLKRAESRWDWEYWMSESPRRLGLFGCPPQGHRSRRFAVKPRFQASVCRDGDGPDWGKPVGAAALDGHFAAGVIPDAGEGQHLVPETVKIY